MGIGTALIEHKKRRERYWKLAIYIVVIVIIEDIGNEKRRNLSDIMGLGI